MLTAIVGLWQLLCMRGENIAKNNPGRFLIDSDSEKGNITFYCFVI